MSTASGMRWVLADGLSIGANIGGRMEAMCPLRRWRPHPYVLCGCGFAFCWSLSMTVCHRRGHWYWWEDRGNVSLLEAAGGLADGEPVGADVGGRT